MIAVEPDHLGKYEIRRVLGRGAMSIVYEGFDPVIERRVAIKTVHLPDRHDAGAEEDLARFRREAQAAGRLSHSNVVSVYDYGETDDVAFIVMEYVEGSTLKSALDQGERFAVPDVIGMISALLDGLAYSHENGVIHRDIKPANVMITSDNKIKLADFGVARIDSSSLTMAGAMIGTPSYMSPEQFMGDAVDARTDIYSTGVLLYQLLTGAKPFDGGATAVMHKVLSNDSPAPSRLSVAVSPELDAVVQRAMAKRPEDRFASAAAFAAALAEAGAVPAADPEISTASSSVSPAIVTLEEPHDSRSRTLLRTAGIFMLLGMIWSAAFLHQKTPRKPAVLAAAPAVKTVQPVFTLDDIRKKLAAAVAPVPCTLLQASATTKAVRLNGIVGKNEGAVLRQSVKAFPMPVRLAVDRFNGPYCPVLDVVSADHPLFAAEPDRLSLSLANGAKTLADGQLILVNLRMPAYPSYLEVDYFSHTGAVYHLYPAPEQPVAVKPASSLVTLGNPAAGSEAWLAGPPYGRDMILAVASSVPILDADRFQNELAQPYLAALSAALKRIRTAGGKIAASVLLLETVPKPEGLAAN